ncbi:MAG: DNA primase [Clostridium sp.]|nr:DNA primase [Clostridium sp.]
MQISEDVIERIKNENDIVDVISESVRLKRSGRNYMGLCPFHNEKSPSFSVSQDKQIYKCFSCNEAGNVITFVMKQKNKNFIEAIKYLAERARIPLEIGKGESSQITKKRELLYKINKEAGRFFFSNLTKIKKAKEYFLNRGIDENTIKKFGLGYSLDMWQGLIDHLLSKGYKYSDLLDDGLILKGKNENNYYDRFRNRVMFPVFDKEGRVIGFGGRVLDDSKPKYLNSPETLIFHKGTNLYGLNFALKNKIEDRTIIIVEGYMDCVSLHQYGITNSVASLGTALTEQQARLLKRYADTIIISYDADVAGQNATQRGIDILTEAGFQVKILTIPEAKDPDEFLRVNGREAFLSLVKSAIPIIEYRLNRAADGLNLKNNNQLIEYGRRASIILSQVDAIEKDVYIKKISENTGIREQSLYDMLSKEKNKKDEKYVNNMEETSTKLYVEPAYIKAEKLLLKLMLNDEYYENVIKQASEEDFTLKEYKKIFNLIINARDEKVSDFITHIESRCDDVDSSSALVEISELNIVEADNINILIFDCIKKIRMSKLELSIEELKKEQKELERKGMVEESIQLLGELSKINKELQIWKKTRFIDEGRKN